jgi:hypothetical protein
MRSFFFGLIVGAVAAVAGLHYFGHLNFGNMPAAEDPMLEAAEPTAVEDVAPNADAVTEAVADETMPEADMAEEASADEAPGMEAVEDMVDELREGIIDDMNETAEEAAPESED